MPKYGLIACFCPVITVEWVNMFDGYRFGKNWELENGKKIGVLAIQKVAKTGNIGKITPVAGNIDYVRYISMQN